MDGPTASSIERRLHEHVDRIAEEHPPIALDSVDYTIHRPRLLRDRFGGVLDYMARVELEVDRNVLELDTLLPDPPEVDRYFYADVWQPQEVRHGLILDELQQRIGRPPTVADLDSVSAKIRILGALSHLTPIQDVVRMLYYLTGLSTERSAVVAYNRLYDGLMEIGETAVAETAIAQIRRQEPGHYAFYKLSARAQAARLRPWQRWLTRRLRRISYAPVGVNDDRQSADLGDVVLALGLDVDLSGFAAEITRVESELLWAHRKGLEVPAYVLAAFRDAVERARAREVAR